LKSRFSVLIYMLTHWHQYIHNFLCRAQSFRSAVSSVAHRATVLGIPWGFGGCSAWAKWA
jgi:hypothetical protein